MSESNTPDAFDALLTELETTADDYWNLSRENALFLSLLIKGIGARRILEVGTSNGYAALWFVRAAREVAPAEAQVITLEADAGRAALARANFRRAGVEDAVSLVEGDARALIPQQTGLFDFVFLDAEKAQYADYLRLVLPLVRPGGFIVGDDTVSLRDQMPDYVALAFSHPDVESVDVPIDDGIILSRKRG